MEAAILVPREMSPLADWARMFLTLTKVAEVCVTLPVKAWDGDGPAEGTSVTLRYRR